jgi:hypothetical protein
VAEKLDKLFGGEGIGGGRGKLKSEIGIRKSESGKSTAERRMMPFHGAGDGCDEDWSLGVGWRLWWKGKLG